MNHHRAVTSTPAGKHPSALTGKCPSAPAGKHPSIPAGNITGNTLGPSEARELENRPPCPD